MKLADMNRIVADAKATTERDRPKHWDGLYLFLNPAHINDWELVCRLKANYPHTWIVVQQEIPRA